MWLTGRLTPDFKTIADFRKDNGDAIRGVCREFVILCRQLNLFANAIVAIDGSKFKAVNNRDRNFTPTKIQRAIQEVEKSINRYLDRLDKVDRDDPAIAEASTARLGEKISALKQEMKRLKEIQAKLEKTPDKQISFTDPDARSMRTRGTGIVGYNVQTAVDTRFHLIVAHRVVNTGTDRDQLFSMAIRARAAMGVTDLSVVADRGYFDSDEILACHESGIIPYVPKPRTSPNEAKGFFEREAFRYDPSTDEYRCPADEHLKRRMTVVDNELTKYRYWSSNCGRCHLKPKCTTGKERRVTRWEHEALLDDMRARLEFAPDMMARRRETVEHPYGTIKSWMGATHFLTRTLENVRTEMSLHILSYNMKRMINILGVKFLTEVIRV